MSADDLLDAMEMLDGLPLSNSEFGLAVSRLKNAHRYLVASEPGAARWELRMLLGSIRHREDGKPIRRTFRRRSAAASGYDVGWQR